jgi:K+-sensing histidine kinase KdpD
MTGPLRLDSQGWESLTPEQLLDQLVYELYTPVSTLGGQIKRLAEDDDPLSEDEYDAILDQMHTAVRQLSRMVVSLKRYNEGRRSG